MRSSLCSSIFAALLLLTVTSASAQLTVTSVLEVETGDKTRLPVIGWSVVDGQPVMPLVGFSMGTQDIVLGVLGTHMRGSLPVLYTGEGCTGEAAFERDLSATEPILCGGLLNGLAPAGCFAVGPPGSTIYKTQKGSRNRTIASLFDQNLGECIDLEPATMPTFNADALADLESLIAPPFRLKPPK